MSATYAPQQSQDDDIYKFVCMWCVWMKNDFFALAALEKQK